MLERVSALQVWAESGLPSLVHWKPNGPVPWAAVLKITVSPGQLVCDTSASAVGGAFNGRVGGLGKGLEAAGAGSVEKKRMGGGRGGKGDSWAGCAVQEGGP